MQIEIPDQLLVRLQKHAIPFIDTPLSVIEKWADFYDRHNQQKPESKTASPIHVTVQTPADERRFDPQRPPSLLHTRVSGEFGSASFSNWNDLVRIAHVHAFKQAPSFEELRKVTRAQIKKGSYSDEGYHFVPDIGISVQGVDATHAWEYALRLAIYLKVPLKAEIEWRNNDKAAYPGKRGILAWTP